MDYGARMRNKLTLCLILLVTACGKTATVKTGVATTTTPVAPQPASAGFMGSFQLEPDLAKTLQIQQYLAAVKQGEDEGAALGYIAAITPPPPTPAPKPAFIPPRPAAPKSFAPAPAPSGGSAPGGFLACVRGRESGGNYTAHNPSGADGAYQVMPGTWNHYRGYASAGQAPPSVQDEFAADLLRRAGKLPWAGGQYTC